MIQNYNNHILVWTFLHIFLNIFIIITYYTYNYKLQLSIGT